MDAIDQKDFQADRPAQPQSTPSSPKQIPLWVFIVIGLLFIALIGFLIFRPSPSIEPLPTPNQTPTTTSTPSPTPGISKTDIEIEVLNGTGIAGEAKFLQDKLIALDYKNITADNASHQDYQTTEAYFSDDIPETIITEIIAQLEDIYQKVSQKSFSDSQEKFIRVITGLKKGATPKPTSTSDTESTSSASSE
jgi:hypothetical protein